MSRLLQDVSPRCAAFAPQLSPASSTVLRPPAGSGANETLGIAAGCSFMLDTSAHPSFGQRLGGMRRALREISEGYNDEELTLILDFLSKVSDAGKDQTAALQSADRS